MHARLIVSPTPAERCAEWSGHVEDDSCGARSISSAADAGARMRHDGRDDAGTWSHLLDRYLEAWAEANPSKIFAATAHGYHFDDPLVGRFSRWSIPVYFESLQGRFARAGASAARDLAFFIHGPMDGPPRRGRLTFFREAPRLGLTGVTLITISERGVIAEAVAYDLNLALDVLRDRSEQPE
jgi:hypothetical protein